MIGDHGFLINTDQRIGVRLKEFEQNVCSLLAILCKALDTRFNSDIIADTYVIRMYVDTTSVTLPPPLTKGRKSTIAVIRDENSVHMVYHKITKFVHSTSWESCRPDTLLLGEACRNIRLSF